MVPVENSSSGSINDVYDLLGKYACHIVGEQLVRVEHCLLGVPGAKVDEITQVFSHEQGFAQCPKFLGEHPAWVTTPYFNTAIAARHVAEMGDKHCAAIASRLAAKHYGLKFSRRISTRLTATTRGLSSSARRPRPSAFRIRRPSPSLCAMSAAR